VYQWDAVTQTFTSPRGFFDVMIANANGTWTCTKKGGDVWQFNTAGYLVSVTNRYGQQATFNRNALQAITSIVDYAGRATTVGYNAAGFISTLTDWGGRITSFSYTAQGYLASITRPSTTFYDRQLGQIVTRPKTYTFTYTSGTGTAQDGNLLTMVDDRGLTVMTNTYDGSDRNTSITLRGRTWSHTYLPNGSTQVVDPDGVTTVYSFNATGAIIRKEVFTKTGPRRAQFLHLALRARRGLQLRLHHEDHSARRQHRLDDLRRMGRHAVRDLRSRARGWRFPDQAHVDVLAVQPVLPRPHVHET